MFCVAEKSLKLPQLPSIIWLGTKDVSSFSGLRQQFNTWCFSFNRSRKLASVSGEKFLCGQSVEVNTLSCKAITICSCVSTMVREFNFSIFLTSHDSRLKLVKQRAQQMFLSREDKLNKKTRCLLRQNAKQSDNEIRQTSNFKGIITRG